MKKITAADNICIVDDGYFEKTVSSIISAGKEKLHVLADFDRTLTRAFVDGNKIPSLISLLRSNNCLGADYSTRSYAHYDKYSGYENNSNLTREQRAEKMQEWWDAAHGLMIECGLTKNVMDEVMAKRQMKLRVGAKQFIDRLAENLIPLVILSAGPAYMIQKFFELEGCMSKNIDIIANWYEYDEKGRMIGTKEPLIHTSNKYEITVDNFPAYEAIKKRKNVLLLGDTIDDVGMIEGFDYDNLLKIGFLCEDVENQLPKYKQYFDMIILNDGPIDPLNQLLDNITKKAP
ncbi:MAG: haloacid dehalogenase-like hydrolase [Candidatus Magasanikbacteria bacterium]|nr:haloacid dehalogenase-like hydrolase [Candidatus Magasanikbacteria bacterium]